jgi:hypothetical protein
MFPILVSALIILHAALTANAETVYYTPDGKPVKNVTAGSPDKSTSPSSGSMEADAEKAARAGFKVGQTVKIENNIVYRLAKDSKTGKFTFKKYRRSASPNSRKSSGHKIKKQTERTSAPRQTPLEKESVPPVKTDGNPQDPNNEKDVKPESQPEKPEPKKAFVNGGETRQMPRLSMAADYEHNRLEHKTVLDRRTLTTVTGTVPDTTGVGTKDVFSTKLHQDRVAFRFGLAAWLELNLQAGATYESFSDIGDTQAVYGGGFRTGLTRILGTFYPGVYVDLEGHYLQGKTKGDLTDAYGDTYRTDSDFKEMEFGIEAGYMIRQWTFFCNLTYLDYSEDVTQTRESASLYRLDDSFSEQGNLNTLIGVEYTVSPSLKLYIEYQGPNRQGPSAGIEYRL